MGKISERYRRFKNIIPILAKVKKKIILLILLATVLALPYATDAQSEFCNMVSRIKGLTWQIGGSIVVIGWVIAGILYLTSIGSQEKMSTAKKAMMAAIIGTILVIMAGAASGLIIDAFGWSGTTPMCP